MLDVLNSWIDEIPPLPTPQRFGNLAFRSYGQKLQEELENLLHNLLPITLHESIPLIAPYFLTSFGSFQRLDYGTGHETSFALFLYCLTVIGFFKMDPEEERRIVLRVFERYFRLVWRLQDVYNLEPAGSHGVWGLDDYGFLGYVFGSGQLRDDDDTPPSIVLHPPLPSTNLYYMSIMRIYEIKTGPFHEHSHQLHSIAQGVPRWSKVNSGMFKMYDAEVLGKRVVVQHLPLGGLIPWDPLNVPARTPHSSSMHSPIGYPSKSTCYLMPMTPVPWPSNPSNVPSPTVYDSNSPTPRIR